MANLNHTVNPDEIEGDFEALPAGEYLAVIENSLIADTKSGSGKMLKLTYQVIDGVFRGKKIFENLNIINSNLQAQEIAKKTLNSIGVACGVSQITDSEQLHNIPLIIDVVVKEDDQYGRQNRIKKHIAVKEGDEPAQSSAPKEAKKPAATTTGKKPWEKK